jgi:hypothetical protein
MELVGDCRIEPVEHLYLIQPTTFSSKEIDVCVWLNIAEVLVDTLRLHTTR